MNEAGAREDFLKLPGFVEQGTMVFVVPPLEHAQNIRNLRLIARTQQAKHFQQAGQGARRIGPAAEPEQINLIVRLRRFASSIDRRRPMSVKNPVPKANP